MNIFKNKLAFTLAEVLITLGIIGIVAAITIPGLISANNKRITETRLKRFYSVFNQAIKLSTVDNGDVEGWDDYWDTSSNSYDENGNVTDKMDQVNNAFEKYLMPYMKVMYKKEVRANGIKQTLYVLADGSAFTFRYMDSRDIIFFPKDAEKCIEKSGNTQGICSFMFIFYPISNSSDWQYHYRMGLEPYKYNWNGNKQQLYSGGTYSCTSSKGYYCTEIIKQNGWKIPTDYPKQIRYY